MERRDHALSVNGERRTLRVRPDTPLLWALRDALGLVGTKYGCGRGLCGACTVHVDGRATRSCTLATADAVGREITTIEALAREPTHPLVDAWIETQVPQCGYCQSGQIMAAAALLAEQPDPDDATIASAMSGNLCRCGAYTRIRAAIRLASRST